MPPRTALSLHAVRAVRAEAYVCPSCLVKQGLRQHSTRAKRNTLRSTESTPRTVAGRIESRLPYQTQRHASNYALASSTAVGAPTSVPAHLRDLHQHLLLLQDKASSYVDLSRIQLAIRSLESEDPVIRVAFLGLGPDGVEAARKLAKVLLADELGHEEQWERDLMARDDGRSVLLKYGDPGEETGVQGVSSPLIREMSIPSARLRRWRLEILITYSDGGYNESSAESIGELEDSILVPPVTMPNSMGGRVGFVRYPAHKALIVAHGVSGAIHYGSFATKVTNGDLINSAISLPLRAQTAFVSAGGSTQKHAPDTLAISADLAEHALNAFRANIANGVVYSESWQQSRVGYVSDWLAKDSDTDYAETGMKPAVENMLDSILDRTLDAIDDAKTVAETSSTALTVPEPRRTSLQSAIASWSEEAHRDLQVNLSTALESPTWRRTTWWRLFWRIDEVSISGGDLLRRGWLVEAEQSLAFLSGRMLEAGVASVDDLKRQGTVSTGPLPHDPAAQGEIKLANAAQKPGTVAELLEAPPAPENLKEQRGLDVTFDPPWPQTIRIARDFKLNAIVPTMHLKAQALLLSSLGTMGGTGALAGWLWVATGGVALYEAGAIAALGLVWGLRRLQKKWSKERQTFVDATMEDGRTVLSHLEQRLRKLVQDGGRVPISEDDKKQWEEAQKALDACENAFARVLDPSASAKQK